MFFAHPLALEAFVRSFFVCLCASVSACAIRSSTWSPLVCALGRVCQRAAAQSENHKNWASAASSSSCWLPWRKLQFQQVHRISSRMCMSETRLRKVQTDGFWSYTCRRVVLDKSRRTFLMKGPSPAGYGAQTLTEMTSRFLVDLIISYRLLRRPRPRFHELSSWPRLRAPPHPYRRRHNGGPLKVMQERKKRDS